MFGTQRSPPTTAVSSGFAPTFTRSTTVSVAGSTFAIEPVSSETHRLVVSGVTQSGALSSSESTTRFEAGSILLRVGEEEEGLRWLRSALRVDPTHRPTHRALADYYQRKGDKEQAEKHRKMGR